MVLYITILYMRGLAVTDVGEEEDAKGEDGLLHYWKRLFDFFDFLPI